MSRPSVKLESDSAENRILILLGILSISLVAYRFILMRTRANLPPGPPQKFIVGNYRMLPKKLPWLTYTSWAKMYGSIFHLRVYNQYTIILNSSKAVIDLLESRASIYSDRPLSVMRHHVLKRDGDVFGMRYDDPRFRKYRKMMHSGLNPRAVKSYRPIQRKEVNTLLRGLKETPDEFIAHLRRNAGALILKVTYGYEVSGDNDNFVKRVQELLVYSARTFSQPFIVEFLPILRFLPSWFPFIQFKKVAKELETIAPEKAPFDWAKKIIDSGAYTDSFVSRLLRPEEGPEPDEDEEDIIKWCSSALYVGGADTTVSAMTSFIRLMALYPSIQARAQAEIDSVTGKEKLPELEDKEAGRMKFVEAVIKEVVRWAPVAPLGLRHRVMEEDVYEGWRIPKGSTIIANIWEIMHDPENYPNPDVFDPERHLGENPQVDPFKFVFGFGRRVCPGAHLAEQSLFLTISNILAVFDLKASDSDLELVKNKNYVGPSDIEWFGGTICHMKPFSCRITPRVPHLLRLIEEDST